MTPVEFFAGSGAIAWGVLLYLCIRAVRSGVERVRNMRRRLSWALWGWSREPTRYY